MTNKEIDKVLEKDFDAFYTSVYPEALPHDFIPLFCKALLCDAPQNNQIHIAKIRAIIAKQQEELTIGEVGVMQTLILRIPPEKLYPNFEKYLEYHEEVEQVPMKFNPLVSRFQETMNRKKIALMNLSGTQTTPIRSIIAQA